MLALLSVGTASALLNPSIKRQSVALDTGVSMEWLSAAPQTPSNTPAVLFVHGTFHGAWCWEAHWMERFAAAGVECHAISLRGTSGSPVDQKSVKITEHVEDLRAFIDQAFADDAPPVLVGHSFGGASVLKYLEAEYPARGAALLCSVPPSGNAPMVGRFLKRSLKQAWLITRGFAMKSAASDPVVCRDLFFDEKTPMDEIERYLPLLTADAKVGLDVGHFTRNLPSKEADYDGVAFWVEGSNVPTLVLGAERDGVVDREGVEETARFLGEEAEFFDLPHDIMLCDGWEAPADRVIAFAKSLAGSKSGRS